MHRSSSAVRYLQATLTMGKKGKKGKDRKEDRKHDQKRSRK